MIYLSHAWAIGFCYRRICYLFDFNQPSSKHISFGESSGGFQHFKLLLLILLFKKLCLKSYRKTNSISIPSLNCCVYFSIVNFSLFKHRDLKCFPNFIFLPLILIQHEMMTTTTLPFNNRVPSSGENIDSTLDTSVEEIIEISETVTLRHPMENEEISNSFTFSASLPVIKRQESEEQNIIFLSPVFDDEDVALENCKTLAYYQDHKDKGVSKNCVETTDDDGDDEVVSASFTMPPPPASITCEKSAFNAIVPVCELENIKTDEDVWETKRNSKTYIMATINVSSSTEESSNANTKKTDLEEPLTTIKAPVSPPLVSDSHVLAHSPKDESNSISPTDEKNIMGCSDEVRLREKRSIFDMDNASSLTLAEKLRNEANKYSETTNKAQSDIELSAAAQNSEEVNSSSIQGSSTERRPSWRLKLDSGSKV